MKNDLEDKLHHLDKLGAADLQELIDDVVAPRFRWARVCCGFSRPKLTKDDEFKDSLRKYEQTKIKEIENGNFGTSNVPRELLKCILAYALFFDIPSIDFIDPGLNEEKFKEEIKKGRKKKGERLDDIEKDVLTHKHGLFDSPINDKMTIGGDVSFDDVEKHLSDYHHDQKVKNRSVFRVLERVFTPLEMVENPELAHDSIENVWDLDGDFNNYSKILLKDQDGQASLEQQPSLRGDVFELMDQESQLVLLGEPGTGKTTCLQWRCLNFIKNYQRGGKTAVYVPLAKYRPNMDIIALVYQESRIPQQYLCYLLEKGRLVILLDALNECKVQSQDLCIGQIQSFLTDWPDIELVLTFRVQTWRQDFPMPAFTVQSLSRENQVRFLGAYLEDTKRAEDILDQLHAQPGGDIIAQNPWMLFMIREITREGEDLPRGRALMYRRYVQRWYEREFNKAFHSRTDLPWTKKQIFDDLCHIAAHMRFHGYAKEAPRSWLIDTLGSKLTAGRKFLDFLGQGIICIVSQEDDIFGFAHETLQEYLSAEYVLKKPELLEKISEDEAYIWNLVLAYAYELEKNPSSTFIEAAWRLNPLLIALATENINSLRPLSLPKISPFMEHMIHTLFQEKRPQFHPTEYKHPPSPKRTDLAVLKLFGFQYLFMTNNVALERLETIKNDWGRGSVHMIFYLARHGLLNRNHVSRSKFKRLAKIALRPIDMYWLHQLILNNWVTKDDFSKQNEDPNSLIRLASPISAAFLIKTGLINKEELIDIIPIWKQRFIRTSRFCASIPQIAALNRMKLITQEDLKTIIEVSSLRQASRLVELGLVSKEAFIHRVPSWIKTADLSEAKRLISAQLTTVDNLIDRVPSWIENAELRSASALIKSGLANKTDFSDRIPFWIETADLYDASILVVNGLARKEDFSDRIPSWVETADPDDAGILVASGLANKTDLLDRIPSWIETADIVDAEYLIDSGLASKADFSDRIPFWIETASSHEAKRIVDMGLASKKDFPEMLFS